MINAFLKMRDREEILFKHLYNSKLRQILVHTLMKVQAVMKLKKNN